MHDPDVVLFEIRRPWPHIRKLRYDAPRGMSFPFARALGFEAYWPSVVTVWHNEPNGADSGTVCRDGRGLGSKLSLTSLRFAARHRRHLWVQVKPWQTLCRRLWTRCEECGQPFRRRQAVFSRNWNGDGPGWRKPERAVLHDKCSALLTYRGKAQERLDVIDLIADVWNVDSNTVQQLARNREILPSDAANADNMAWRVFYDLKIQRDAKAGVI